MGIPATIRDKKPTRFGAVEIRSIGGYYYVYQVSSQWDPIKHRARKITGKSIGKITEAEGYIPNANGMRLIQEMDRLPKEKGAPKEKVSTIPDGFTQWMASLFVEGLRQKLKDSNLAKQYSAEEILEKLKQIYGMSQNSRNQNNKDLSSIALSGEIKEILGVLGIEE